MTKKGDRTFPLRNAQERNMFPTVISAIAMKENNRPFLPYQVQRASLMDRTGQNRTYFEIFI